MNQPRCTATTRAGAACRSFAPSGRPFCVMHDPELADKVARARARGGTVAAKLRILHGKRARLDTTSALVRFTAEVVQDTLAGTVEPDVARTVLYGCSILRQLAEHSLDKRLAEVERILAQRRVG